MPFFQSNDDVPIHGEARGSGSTNLLFLHGWGGDGTTWTDVTKRLNAGHYRTFSIDWRGHGKSGVPPSGYTCQQFGDDVLAVADGAGLKTFIPVGFSMGGKLACYLAAKYPERIPAQILVAPAPPGMVPIDRETGLQGCREANDKQKVKDFFGGWFGPGAAGEIVDACCGTIAKTPCFVLEATAEMTLWTSIEPEVGHLILPGLLIFGTNDPVYGEAFQRQKTLPFLTRAEPASVNSGHFIPLEAPADVAGLIDAFVARDCI